MPGYQETRKRASDSCWQVLRLLATSQPRVFLVAIPYSGLQPEADTAIRPPDAAQRDTVHIGSPSQEELERSGPARWASSSRRWPRRRHRTLRQLLRRLKAEFRHTPFRHLSTLHHPSYTTSDRSRHSWRRIEVSPFELGDRGEDKQCVVFRPSTCQNPTGKCYERSYAHCSRTRPPDLESCE